MKLSAGILLFRVRRGRLEFFLVHPGGPYWQNKDEGAWSIPKGEYEEGEDALDAARREFEEETGHPLSGHFLPLYPVTTASRKRITAFALEGDLDSSRVTSNKFELEWPPGSGNNCSFPEVDRGAWFGAKTAQKKINAGQVPLLTQLRKMKADGKIP